MVDVGKRHSRLRHGQKRSWTRSEKTILLNHDLVSILLQMYVLIIGGNEREQARVADEQYDSGDIVAASGCYQQTVSWNFPWAFVIDPLYGIHPVPGNPRNHADRGKAGIKDILMPSEHDQALVTTCIDQNVGDIAGSAEPKKVSLDTSLEFLAAGTHPVSNGWVKIPGSGQPPTCKFGNQ
jgi:hypothetical protein